MLHAMKMPLARLARLAACLLALGAPAAAHAATAAPVYTLEAGLQDDAVVQISGPFVAEVRLTRTLLDEPEVAVDGALGLGNATLVTDFDGKQHVDFGGNVNFGNPVIRKALTMLKVNWVPMPRGASKGTTGSSSGSGRHHRR